MTQTETELDPGERDKLMSRCYGQAQTELREHHRDEFNTLYQRYLKAVGIEWTPRPTPEQLALEQIQKYLTEFPGLAERLADTLASQAQADDADGAQIEAQARE
jgi:hypothetical protein